jgi:class 3 adenylate cyclase
MALALWITLPPLGLAAVIAFALWLRERARARLAAAAASEEVARLREEIARHEAALRAAHEEQVRNTRELARYLPPDVAQRITRAPAEASVMKRRRCRLTVCFVDVVGFTSMADSLAPEDLEVLLNRYFTVMTEIVQSRGGTVDKFMGDGIMVFFSGEGADAEAAAACVRMALDMQEATRRLAEEWQGRGSEVPLRIRIGVATGYCSLGNFGSQNRVQYTAMGGPVNLAARLEAAAPPGGILIAHSTFGLVRDAFVLEPAGQLNLKGLARPIYAYRALREPTLGEPASAIVARR